MNLGRGGEVPRPDVGRESEHQEKSSQSVNNSETDFIETLIEKVSTAWRTARNTPSLAAGGQRSAALEICNELGLCLETLGSTRIEAVSLSIERTIFKSKLRAMQSVALGDLQPEDEYALQSCEEVIFFANIIHGALRRCREAGGVQLETEGSEEVSAPLELLKNSSVESLLAFVFEFLYLSHFQHGTVGDRMCDAALALIEELSSMGYRDLFSARVQESLLGCLETNCEATHRYVKLKSIGHLRMDLPGLVKLGNFLVEIVHSPGGAWKKRPLLELCEALSICVGYWVNSSPMEIIRVYAANEAKASSTESAQNPELGYGCFYSLAERLVPWATGRRKRVVVSPTICHLLCLCPELIDDAVIGIRRKQMSSWAVSATSSFSSTPCLKFMTDMHRNLVSSAYGALNTEVALHSVLIFVRFAAQMVQQLRTGNSVASEKTEQEELFSSLLALVSLSDDRVTTLLFAKGSSGGSTSDQLGTSGNTRNRSASAGGADDEKLGAGFDPAAEGGSAARKFGPAGNSAGRSEWTGRAGLRVDFLEAQFYINQTRFFGSLVPLCLDSSRTDVNAVTALISALVRVVTPSSSHGEDHRLKQPWQCAEALRVRDTILATFFHLTDGLLACAAARWSNNGNQFGFENRESDPLDALFSVGLPWSMPMESLQKHEDLISSAVSAAVMATVSGRGGGSSGSGSSSSGEGTIEVEVGELGRLLSRTGTLASGEIERVRHLMRRNSSGVATANEAPAQKSNENLPTNPLQSLWPLPTYITSPSRAAQDCLYGLLQLIEEAPWLIAGVGGDDDGDSKTIGSHVFPTRGTLRVARVVETLCCLVSLTSLDGTTPSASSTSDSSEFFVGNRSVLSDSKDIQNFGGIDLAQRAKRALLAFFSPRWISSWSSSNLGISFFSVSAVALQAIARQLLHPPRPFDSGQSGVFSSYSSESRCCKDLLTTASEVLRLSNTHIATSLRRHPLFSVLDAVSAESDKQDQIDANRRRRELVESRRLAMAQLTGALLVQLCSPDASVGRLAAQCMASLIDQEDLFFPAAAAAVGAAKGAAGREGGGRRVSQQQGNIFRQIGDQFLSALDGGIGSKGTNLEAAQNSYRSTLSSISVPLFSPSPSSLSRDQSYSLVLAARTIQRRWQVLHQVLFAPFHAVRQEVILTQQSPPRKLSSDGAPHRLQPRTFGENSSAAFFSSSATSTTSSHAAPVRGVIGNSTSFVLPKALFEADNDHWASYSTWLSCMGGLRWYAPTTTSDLLRSSVPHMETELRWVLKDDLVGELFQAYPLGREQPHPRRSTQVLIESVVASGLGTYLAPSLLLHLFTRMHRSLRATRDQRSGRIISEGHRVPLLVHSLLNTLVCITKRHLQEPLTLDDFATATLASLLVSLLQVVTELTANLEEVGRKSSSLSRQDSSTLRQMMADLIAALLCSGASAKECIPPNSGGRPLCVISDELRQQLVATLFEWTYHSGISGRYTLFTDTAAHAAATAASRFGGTQETTQVPISEQHILTGSGDGRGLSLELSYMRALGALLRGLEVRSANTNDPRLGDGSGHQREQVFSTYFHTLIRLLITTAAGKSRSLVEARVHAETLWALTHLLGANLDLAFRKCVNEAERISWHDSRSVGDSGDLLGIFSSMLSLSPKSLTRPNLESDDHQTKEIDSLSQHDSILLPENYSGQADDDPLCYEEHLEGLSELLLEEDCCRGHPLLILVLNQCPLGTPGAVLARHVLKVFAVTTDKSVNPYERETDPEVDFRNRSASSDSNESTASLDDLHRLVDRHSASVDGAEIEDSEIREDISIRSPRKAAALPDSASSELHSENTRLLAMLRRLAEFEVSSRQKPFEQDTAALQVLISYVWQTGDAFAQSALARVLAAVSCDSSVFQLNVYALEREADVSFSSNELKERPETNNYLTLVETTVATLLIAHSSCPFPILQLLAEIRSLGGKFDDMNCDSRGATMSHSRSRSRASFSRSRPSSFGSAPFTPKRSTTSSERTSHQSLPTTDFSLPRASAEDESRAPKLTPLQARKAAAMAAASEKAQALRNFGSPARERTSTDGNWGSGDTALIEDALSLLETDRGLIIVVKIVFSRWLLPLLIQECDDGSSTKDTTLMLVVKAILFMVDNLGTEAVVDESLQKDPCLRVFWPPSGQNTGGQQVNPFASRTGRLQKLLLLFCHNLSGGLKDSIKTPMATQQFSPRSPSSPSRNRNLVAARSVVIECSVLEGNGQSHSQVMLRVPGNGATLRLPVLPFFGSKGSGESAPSSTVVEDGIYDYEKRRGLIFLHHVLHRSVEKFSLKLKKIEAHHSYSEENVSQDQSSASSTLSALNTPQLGMRFRTKHSQEENDEVVLRFLSSFIARSQLSAPNERNDELLKRRSSAADDGDGSGDDSDSELQSWTSSSSSGTSESDFSDDELLPRSHERGYSAYASRSSLSFQFDCLMKLLGRPPPDWHDDANDDSQPRPILGVGSRVMEPPSGLSGDNSSSEVGGEEMDPRSTSLFRSEESIRMHAPFSDVSSVERARSVSLSPSRVRLTSTSRQSSFGSTSSVSSSFDESSTDPNQGVGGNIHGIAGYHGTNEGADALNTAASTAVMETPKSIQRARQLAAWSTFSALVAHQTSAIKSDLDGLKLRRVFYCHGQTLYFIARRVKRSDSNALLLLILEATLPFVDPTGTSTSAVSPSDSPSSPSSPILSAGSNSKTSVGPGSEGSENGPGGVSVVVDAMLFKSEEHGLPVSWFQRLKDTLQPLLQSTRIEKVYVLYASSSLVAFARVLLKHLGLVNLHPTKTGSPLSKLEFVASPSALAKLHPDAVGGLPESTWAVERTLARRWPATMLNCNNNGRSNYSASTAIPSVAAAAAAAVTAGFGGGGVSTGINAKEAFICTTDTFLGVERLERFFLSSEHLANVWCTDFFSLTRFHDIIFEHVGGTAAGTTRGLGSNSSSGGSSSSGGFVVVVTYLEGGSVSSLRFASPHFREIAAVLRHAILRCRQDMEELALHARSPSINRFVEDVQQQQQQQEEYFSADPPPAASSTAPPSPTPSTPTPLILQSALTPPPFTLRPFGARVAQGAPVSSTASSNAPSGSAAASRAVSGSETSGGSVVNRPATASAAVNPAEIFGSLVHLALMHLSSENEATRQKAFHLLVQVQRAFNLNLSLCESLPPLALPSLGAAGPSTRALSAQLASSAPQFTLDVLSCVVRWLRARIMPAAASSAPLASSSSPLTTSSSSSSTTHFPDERLVMACLNVAGPWVENLGHPWLLDHDHTTGEEGGDNDDNHDNYGSDDPTMPFLPRSFSSSGSSSRHLFKYGEGRQCPGWGPFLAVYGAGAVKRTLPPQKPWCPPPASSGVDSGMPGEHNEGRKRNTKIASKNKQMKRVLTPAQAAVLEVLSSLARLTAVATAASATSPLATSTNSSPQGMSTMAGAPPSSSSSSAISAARVSTALLSTLWRSTVAQSPALCEAALLVFAKRWWGHELASQGVDTTILTSASSSSSSSPSSDVSSSSSHSRTSHSSKTSTASSSFPSSPTLASSTSSSSSSSGLTRSPPLRRNSTSTTPPPSSRLQSSESDVIQELLLNPSLDPPPPSSFSSSSAGGVSRRLGGRPPSGKPPQSSSGRTTSTAAAATAAGGVGRNSEVTSTAAISAVAAAAVEYQCLLDVTAALGQGQPERVVSVLARELFEAAVSVGDSACLQEQQQSGGGSSGSSGGNGSGGGRGSDSHHRRQMGKESRSSSCSSSDLDDEDEHQEEVGDTGEVSALPEAPTVGGARGEWARVMVAFRPLHALSFLCRPMLAHLPRLAHTVLLLIGRGPAELRKGLFPLVCNLVHTVVTEAAVLLATSDNENEQQSCFDDAFGASSATATAATATAAAATAAAAEETSGEDGPVPMAAVPAAAARAAGSPVTLSGRKVPGGVGKSRPLPLKPKVRRPFKSENNAHHHHPTNGATEDAPTMASAHPRSRTHSHLDSQIPPPTPPPSTQLPSKATRRRMQLEALHIRVSCLASFVAEPSVRLSFLGARRHFQRYDNGSDGAGSSTAEPEGSGVGWAAALSSPEDLQLPLNVLSELTHCAALVLDLSKNATISNTTAKTTTRAATDTALDGDGGSDDDDDDDDSGGGGGGWVVKWLEIAERVCHRRLLSANSARSFLVMAHLSKVITAWNDLSSGGGGSGGSGRSGLDSRNNRVSEGTAALSHQRNFENLVNETMLVRLIRSLETALHRLSWFGIVGRPTFLALSSILFATNEVYSLLQEKQVHHDRCARKHAKRAAARETSTRYPANLHLQPVLCLPPGCLFWPAVLVAACAEPLSPVFVHAVALIRSSVTHAAAISASVNSVRSSALASVAGAGLSSDFPPEIHSEGPKATLTAAESPTESARPQCSTPPPPSHRSPPSPHQAHTPASPRQTPPKEVNGGGGDAVLSSDGSSGSEDDNERPPSPHSSPPLSSSSSSSSVLSERFLSVEAQMVHHRSKSGLVDGAVTVFEAYAKVSFKHHFDWALTAVLLPGAHYANAQPTHNHQPSRSDVSLPTPLPSSFKRSVEDSNKLPTSTSRKIQSERATEELKREEEEGGGGGKDSGDDKGYSQQQRPSKLRRHHHKHRRRHRDRGNNHAPASSPSPSTSMLEWLPSPGATRSSRAAVLEVLATCAEEAMSRLKDDDNGVRSPSSPMEGCNSSVSRVEKVSKMHDQTTAAIGASGEDRATTMQQGTSYMTALLGVRGVEWVETFLASSEKAKEKRRRKHHRLAAGAADGSNSDIGVLDSGWGEASSSSSSSSNKNPWSLSPALAENCDATPPRARKQQQSQQQQQQQQSQQRQRSQLNFNGSNGGSPTGETSTLSPPPPPFLSLPPHRDFIGRGDDDQDSQEDEDQDNSDETRHFFFNSQNFPDVTSGAFALSVLFGIFFDTSGSGAGGNGANLSLLTVIHDAVDALPEAFREIRGAVLPRLTRYLLEQGSTLGKVVVSQPPLQVVAMGASLREAISDLLVLAFEQEEREREEGDDTHGEVDRKPEGSGSSSSEYGGGAVDDDNAGGDDAIKISSPFVTNLDLDADDGDNDCATVRDSSARRVDEDNDGASSLRGHRSDEDDKGQSGSDNDIGVGPWGASNEGGVNTGGGSGRRRQKKSQTGGTGALLVQLGFAQLLHFQEVDDDDDENDEGGDESGCGGGSARTTLEVAMDPGARERVAALAAEMFGEARSRAHDTRHASVAVAAATNTTAAATQHEDGEESMSVNTAAAAGADVAGTVDGSLAAAAAAPSLRDTTRGSGTQTKARSPPATHTGRQANGEEPPSEVKGTALGVGNGSGDASRKSAMTTIPSQALSASSSSASSLLRTRRRNSATASLSVFTAPPSSTVSSAASSTAQQHHHHYHHHHHPVSPRASPLHPKPALRGISSSSSLSSTSGGGTVFTTPSVRRRPAPVLSGPDVRPPRSRTTPSTSSGCSTASSSSNGNASNSFGNTTSSGGCAAGHGACGGGVQASSGAQGVFLPSAGVGNLAISNTPTSSSSAPMSEGGADSVPTDSPSISVTSGGKSGKDRRPRSQSPRRRPLSPALPKP